MIMMVVGGLMSTIYDWDVLSRNNDKADDLINWQEGQKPSTINDSARTMMKRIADYITDRSGALQGQFVLQTNPNKTLITLRSSSNFTSYINGITLCFQAMNKNNGPTTIVVDTLASRPIYMSAEHGYSELVPGSLQKDCIYEIVYRAGPGHWFLLNPTPVKLPPPPVVRLFPAGTIAAFGMQSMPDGWLLCDGAAHSRSTYKDLLDAIGLVWGIGDGVNTFNVPDLRGMFLRGYDDGRGIDRNRAFADKQQGSFRIHDIDIDSSEGRYTERMRRDTTQYIRSDADALLWLLHGPTSADPGRPLERPWISEAIKPSERADLIVELRRLLTHGHSITTEWVGGAETRPINMSIVFGIKT